MPQVAQLAQLRDAILRDDKDAQAAWVAWAAALIVVFRNSGEPNGRGFQELW